MGGPIDTLGRLRPVAVVTVWAVACVGGLAGLAGYQSSPGPAAPRRDWPAETSLRLAASATDAPDTLLLVLHPRCPCSRATVDNLAVLLAHCPPGRVATTVLMVRPAGVAPGWERTGLWSAAAAIPGVTVLTDDGGVEAARFGAVTSGQALLFSPAGRLLFRGGITPGRGHAGDSGGMDAIAALARGEPAAVVDTPVFGCPVVAGPVATSAEGDRTCPR